MTRRHRAATCPQPVARAAGDAEVELLTLEALARARPGQARALLAAADRLLPAAAHLVTDADRIDRMPVRNGAGPH